MNVRKSTREIVNVITKMLVDKNVNTDKLLKNIWRR